MKKALFVLVAALLVVASCLALASCSPKCSVPGCNNSPAELLGVKSEYCLLHIANELG